MVKTGSRESEQIVKDRVNSGLGTNSKQWRTPSLIWTYQKLIRINDWRQPYGDKRLTFLVSASISPLVTPKHCSASSIWFIDFPERSCEYKYTPIPWSSHRNLVTSTYPEKSGGTKEPKLKNHSRQYSTLSVISMYQTASAYSSKSFGNLSIRYQHRTCTSNCYKNKRSIPDDTFTGAENKPWFCCDSSQLVLVGVLQVALNWLAMSPVQFEGDSPVTPAVWSQEI